jgi:hypothetical protein
MAKFIENPSLVASFGAKSRDLIAPFTPRQAAQVLADVALQSQPRKTSTLCAGSQPTVDVYS